MIIELIGPAGAGKSTLSKALAESISHARVETQPFYRKIEDIPFFIRNTFSMLPTLSRIYYCREGMHPSWEQFLTMVILNGWHQVLAHKDINNESVFILDQGPVYMLMELTLFGSKKFTSPNMEKWWEYIFRSWAGTIDFVIWLDTSLPELVDRIRKRKIWHSVKDRSDDNAYQYLESYRQIYESVIARLMICSKTLKVLRIDTGQYSIEETVEKVSSELHLDSNLIEAIARN